MACPFCSSTTFHACPGKPMEMWTADEKKCLLEALNMIAKKEEETFLKVSDFKVGCKYRIRTKDWETPDGEVIPGKEKVITILPPEKKGRQTIFDGKHVTIASSFEETSWLEFLRVLYHKENPSINLLNPETIASYEVISEN